MIGWFAALRPADSSETGTMAEAVAHAAATVSGVDFDEVVARGRAAFERGICCDIYHLPDNELDGAAAIVGADIGATSVYDVRRFTYRAPRPRRDRGHSARSGSRPTAAATAHRAPPRPRAPPRANYSHETRRLLRQVRDVWHNSSL